MTDPVSMTAGAIATLAFQKFIESSAGKLGEKYTMEAIAKMESLLKRIWTKLRGKPRIEEVRASIEKTHKITPEQINQVAAYLQVAIDDDPQFGSELQALAQEINAGKLQDNSNMVQNVTGDNNMNVQAKAEQGGKQWIADKQYFGTSELD